MGFRKKFAGVAVSIVLAVLACAPFASADPTPEYEQFSQCPYENLEMDRCVYGVFDGSYSIGSKTISLQNQITLQGGYTGEGSEIEFHGASNGITLSKTAQPLPGGLSGVTAPPSWPKELQEWFNELIGTGLTGVDATLELAGPATGITLNYENLFEEEGTALGLPVKIKLDNPILGNNCYIGSDKAPIQLELTTGTSGSLNGTPGEISFNGSLTITTLTGLKVVDGTYAVPGASGCGGIFSTFVDPLVNSLLGLPSASGKNAATLTGVLEDADAAAVRD
jgi:hypothetical protein